MKHYILTHLLLLALALSVQAAPLRVVTSTPDLADFARHVGGSRIEVKSLVSGREDTHNVLMKPSMITLLAKADLFIEMGLDMEHAYAPALLAESRNSSIQPGKSGFLDASRGISVIGVPESLDRSEGDVHPHGNPHWNLDPQRCQQAVINIADTLSELDPPHAEEFQANAKEYNARLAAKLQEWDAAFAGQDIRFVSYHPHFAYFADRFHLKEMGTIQPKAGVEPGPRAIEDLIARMKRDGANLVVRESFVSDRFPREIAEQTGARLIAAPIQVGGVPDADDYLTMMDILVSRFAGK